MALEAKKQERESGQALLRRFTKRIQKSGILVRARGNRFFKKPKSQQMKKRSALRRVKSAAERTMLEKLGKITKYQRR